MIELIEVKRVHDIIDNINMDIDRKISIHEQHLDKIQDEKKRSFIKGVIAGLRLIKLNVPLKETIRHSFALSELFNNKNNDESL